jgi:hypothetical protein
VRRHERDRRPGRRRPPGRARGSRGPDRVGPEAVSARSAADARELTGGVEPTVAILDLQLRDGDGSSLGLELKGNRAEPRRDLWREARQVAEVSPSRCRSPWVSGGCGEVEYLFGGRELVLE